MQQQTALQQNADVVIAVIPLIKATKIRQPFNAPDKIKSSVKLRPIPMPAIIKSVTEKHIDQMLRIIKAENEQIDGRILAKIPIEPEMAKKNPHQIPEPITLTGSPIKIKIIWRMADKAPQRICNALHVSMALSGKTFL